MCFYLIPHIRSKSQRPPFWYLIELRPSSALLISSTLLLQLLSLNFTFLVFLCQLPLGVIILLFNKGLNDIFISKKWFRLLWFHVEQRQGADIQGFAGCSPPKAKGIKSLKFTPVPQAKLTTLAQSSHPKIRGPMHSYPCILGKRKFYYIFDGVYKCKLTLCR